MEVIIIMNLEKEFNKASKKLKKAEQKNDNVTYIILASDGEKGFGDARMSKKDLAYLIAGNDNLKDLIEDALFLADLVETEETD
ncbi:hypothetical protein [Staphylococcus phage PT1-1]